MNQKAQDTYLKMQVNTATAWELTALLFNGCIKFMKQALEGIQNKDFEMKNINIKKSVDIIDELLITLNREYEISTQLSALYEYMKEQLMFANLRLEDERLTVCIELMVELRDTWVQSMKQLHSGTKVKS